FQVAYGKKDYPRSDDYKALAPKRLSSEMTDIKLSLRAKEKLALIEAIICAATDIRGGRVSAWA
ncbi:MAG: hypothetical protein SV487_04170, partial [Thermodesulfobacteriota bacterium]|nr:hypothetical protein [Thermodesulfobacteriota bacterium]